MSATEQLPCGHPNPVFVRYRLSEGISQIRVGCLDCKQVISRSLMYSQHPDWRTYPIIEKYPDPKGP